MTETGGWLERRRGGFLLREAAAVALATAAGLAAALALGLVLGRIGLYRWVPEFVMVGWGLAGLALLIGVVRGSQRGRRVTAAALAAELEHHGRLRRGSVTGLTGATMGSPALAALADRRTAAWLSEHGDDALSPARAARGRAVWRGALFAGTGIVFFAAAGPGTGAGAFWHPFAAIERARGPVTLDVSRSLVRRGDSVQVTVTAAGRRAATLFVRATGEPWEARRLSLDSMGRALLQLGPLDSDRFLHATAGGRRSDTVRVRVQVPAFLSDLQLMARYPDYLERADEPLAPGPDTVSVPVGTRIVTRGRVTVPVGVVAWTAGERAVGLDVDGAGTGFAGAFRVTRSGTWTLRVEAEDGSALEGDAPALVLVAVPDSAPVVTVPIPGADTTAPASLRQPIVVDVRDDHRVSRVEVESRRVSRLGTRGEPVRETIALPEAGVERAVLQWLLDLNERGFLPGDTAYFKVRAVDNAPVPHTTETREFALRLPSMYELRQQARAEARALAQAADSLAQRQRDVQRQTEDLSTERDRGTERAQGYQPGDDQLGFRAAERAGEVANEQTAIARRAEELQQRLQELSEAAWQAGLTDPEWHQQLRDLQDLLRRAMTPELEEAMRALEEAMRNLDASAVQEALERLAEAQERLREELERSRTLFERAALEGEMTTLAEDAEELALRQEEWNRSVEQGADSALAAQERQLAEQVDSLARALQELERELQQAGAQPQDTSSSDRAQRASSQMQAAAQAAQQGQQQQAGQAGGEASQQLEPIAQDLREQRDQIRQEWREEVLEAMDHALVETADLARQQTELTHRLERGDATPDLRSAQAAVRDGVDRVIERLQNAAGKNALVSPRLGTALGLAREKMTSALLQLQQANPNTRAAGADAGDAIDGLNAVAYQLLRSRGDVQSSASGSGLQEAIERMAQLAQQQQAMAGQASGMLPLIQMGGQMLMQQLRSLARQQRALAEELERMRAEGDQSGAGELAEEARELARLLEAGVLDRQMVERQERLFRRLLDEGRTLRGNEEDDQKERQSRTGSQDNRLVPETERLPSRGLRYPYPTWQELQRLSPEERRLILDYFRRLNDAARKN